MEYVETREYIITYNEITDPPHISVAIGNDYRRQSYYSSVPTPEQSRAFFDADETTPVHYDDLFVSSDCIVSPRLPEGADRFSFCFSRCSYLEIAPAVPDANSSGENDYMFQYCTSLKQPALIPKTMTDVRYWYRGCTSLLYPVSIPASVDYINLIYDGCTNVSGEMVVRPSSLTGKSNALRDTTQQITLYGDRTLCESIAATANNGNAQWSAWYDPIPAVTDRGVGSRTTAEDMTRMVRNGVLAVPTYAPGRMRYQQGDIVRIDEWNALVEAAQTIDPTVTYSTNYSNLNKIEAAFDSAL